MEENIIFDETQMRRGFIIRSLMTQTWKNVEDNQEKDILWNKGRAYYLGKEVEGTICICKWNKWGWHV